MRAVPRVSAGLRAVPSVLAGPRFGDGPLSVLIRNADTLGLPAIRSLPCTARTHEQRGTEATPQHTACDSVRRTMVAHG
jgi:hypothetical protein